MADYDPAGDLAFSKVRDLELRMTDAEARLARAEALINELVGKLQAEPALSIQYAPHRQMETLPRTTSP